MTRYTSRGTPITTWSIYGMPRIPDGMLDSTFFLYRDEEDANSGANFGGSGFYIYMPSEMWGEKGISYFYAVSNRHVSVNGGCSVIRINTVDGKTENINLDVSDWIFDENGDDLAIAPMPQLRLEKYKISPVPIDLIYTEDYLCSKDKLNVGIGDDVFMLGRFSQRDSSESNQPNARFGHISSMPSKVYNDKIKKEVKSYFIDMNSKGGFSGSPVFAYRTPGSNLAYTLEHKKHHTGSMLLLLGIHWGQFKEDMEIKKGELSNDDDMRVIGKSGMCLSVPSWKILDLLNGKKLKAIRADNDKKWGEKFIRENNTGFASAELHDEEDSSHKEDFNNLLDAAVRGKQ